ncbi:MAG: dihydrofolate reductase, partial [Sphingobacteriales bacterium]
MSGRDIIYDQKYKHNLRIRRTLDAIYTTYKGDKNSDDWKKFQTYTKRVWFSNGIHHHYSNAKLIPEFSFDYFKTLLQNSDQSQLPLDGQTVEQLAAMLNPVMFDKNVDAKLVNLAQGTDNIKTSANNFYEGVTQKEVEDFYASKMKKGETEPVMYGLNSMLVKENGKIVEKTWKVGGMYSPAIEKIVFW